MLIDEIKKVKPKYEELSDTLRTIYRLKRKISDLNYELGNELQRRYLSGLAKTRKFINTSTDAVWDKYFSLGNFGFGTSWRTGLHTRLDYGLRLTAILELSEKAKEFTECVKSNKVEQYLKVVDLLDKYRHKIVSGDKCDTKVEFKAGRKLKLIYEDGFIELENPAITMTTSGIELAIAIKRKDNKKPHSLDYTIYGHRKNEWAQFAVIEQIYDEVMFYLKVEIKRLNKVIEMYNRFKQEMDQKLGKYIVADLL